jgi:multiple sugar transport system permease protein/raffinose/stachyose/melibiose transport system permease protein
VHSGVVVTLGAAVATCVAALAGYAFAKMDLPFRRTALAIVIGAIAVPLPAIIIPLLIVGLNWHYANNYAGLVLALGALGAPWATYFFYSYFRGVPDGLLDCARVDGATEFGVFMRVALPLAGPALATVFVLQILSGWGNLLLPIVLLPDPTKTMAIANVLNLSDAWTQGNPTQVAGLLIFAAPILCLFYCSQRFLRTELFAGALKG